MDKINFFLKNLLFVSFDIKDLNLLINKYKNNDLIYDLYDIKNPILYKIDFYNNKKWAIFNILNKEKYILYIIFLIIKYNDNLNKKEKKEIYKKLKTLFFLEKKQIINNIKKRNFDEKILKNIFFNNYKYNKGKFFYIFYEIFFLFNNSNYIKKNNLFFFKEQNITYIDIKELLKQKLKVTNNDLIYLYNIEKKFKFDYNKLIND